MTRPVLLRVLLSLLLLISQHMAVTHAMSHWTGGLGAQQVASASHDTGSDLSSAFAQDQTCTQCLAFAQLAGPLASSPRIFVAPELVSLAVRNAEATVAAARPILAFLSRGPPQA